MGLSAQTKPEQHSPEFLHCGGFMHGMHVPVLGSHLKPGQQSLELPHWSGFAQHVPLTGIVFGGHSQSHVVALKTCPVGQGPTQMPVLAHMNVPAWQPHSAVKGSQKLLQHSELSRHPCPPSKQRPVAPALPAPTSEATPPTVARPKIFSAWRLDVVVESVLVSWSNS